MASGIGWCVNFGFRAEDDAAAAASVCESMSGNGSSSSTGECAGAVLGRTRGLDLDGVVKGFAFDRDVDASKSGMGAMSGERS